MHISDTGVSDASAYESADEYGPEETIPWAYLAVVVPLVFLYAVVALLTGSCSSPPSTWSVWRCA